MKKPSFPQKRQPRLAPSSQNESGLENSGPDTDSSKQQSASVHESEERGILEIAQSLQHYSAPIPPAQQFEHYEEVLPGSADRILTMAEKEQNHRIWWERKELLVAAIQAIGGQFLGFVALLVLFGAAMYCTIIGAENVAFAFLGAATVGVIARFLNNRWNGPQGPDS